MIKAVLFDLDGTLLNRDESLLEFIEHQYNRLHPYLSHIPIDEYKRRFVELDCKGYVWKDRVYQQLVEEYKIIHITAEALLDDYINQFKNHCIAFSNLIQMLEELKSQQLLLGMITNGFGQFQLNNIKALGIIDYFDVILVSELEGLKKPNPEIFNRGLTKLGVSADESIFVGDHPVNDVQAARNVGMIGCWKRDSQWGNADCDYLLDNLLDIPEMVKRINIETG